MCRTEAIVREAKCLRMNETFGGIRSPTKSTHMLFLLLCVLCQHADQAHRCAFAVSMLPEKPNDMVPLSKPSIEEVTQAKKSLARLCILKHEDKTPQQRHVLPITAAQEVGWFTTPLVQPQPIFNHPKGQCDVTAYADTYASMAGGMSPFAKAPE